MGNTEDEKSREYYTETAITVDHDGLGKGRVRLDSSNQEVKNRLTKLGAKDVTDQGPGSSYKSFEFPWSWIHIYPPPKISEEERGARRERGRQAAAGLHKKPKEAALEEKTTPST